VAHQTGFEQLEFPKVGARGSIVSQVRHEERNVEARDRELGG